METENTAQDTGIQNSQWSDENTNQYDNNSEHNDGNDFGANQFVQDDQNGNANRFLLDNGVLGNGEAPEWFKSSKYKTVSEQAKAYTELEKRLGGFTGAPENEYEVSSDIVDTYGNELLDPIADFAREQNMSNEALSGLLEKYHETAQQQNEVRMANEMKILGNNGADRIKGVLGWIQNNLGQEAFDIVDSMPFSANTVFLLEAMIGKTKGSRLAGEANYTQKSKEDTEAELRQMLVATDENGQRKMATDLAYRNKVNRLMSEFYNS